MAANTKTYRFLSWGLGTQSTYLGVLSALGKLPKVDAIIHADTQWEREASYKIKEFYTPWFEKKGIPVLEDTAGNIRELGAAEHIHIPFWTSDGGPLQRQCTAKFKINVFKRQARSFAGFDSRKPPHPKPGQFEVWLGYSYDEPERMKPSQVKFMKRKYPLIENKITRNDCKEGLAELGLPVPVKSACIGCPYRSASEWLDLKENSPNEWQDAVAFDRENRNNPLAARTGSTTDHLFVWKKGIPLDEVDLVEEAKKERDGKQLHLFVCVDGCFT